MRFFLEIPRIEELQDSDSSPRREEVGRRTLRDYGGFLLPFFYRARFRLFTLLFSGVSKTTTNKPPDTLGMLESTYPRRALHDRWGDSSRGRFLKKKQWSYKLIVNVEWNSTMTKNILPRKSGKIGRDRYRSDQEYSQQILAIPRLGGPSGEDYSGTTPEGLPSWVCPLGIGSHGTVISTARFAPAQAHGTPSLGGEYSLGEAP